MQEMAPAFPTDAKLMHRAGARLVRLARDLSRNQEVVAAGLADP